MVVSPTLSQLLLGGGGGSVAQRRRRALLLGGGGLVAAAAYATYVRAGSARKSAAEEVATMALDRSASSKKRHKVDVDSVFVKRLIRILKVCMPHPLSRSSMLVILQTVLLLLRTGVTNHLTFVEGKVAEDIVGQNFHEFRKSLFGFMAFCVPASMLNAGMKYCQTQIALSFRGRLTRHLQAKYLHNRAYYTASVLGGMRSADQRITEDVEKFSTSLAELYGYTLKPIVDITIFTGVLTKLIGFKGQAALYGHFVLSSLLLRAISPPLSLIVSIESALSGNYRAAHARVINHAEEIAYNDPPGGAAENAILETAFNKLRRHVGTTAGQKFWHSIFDNYLLKYSASTVSLITFTSVHSGGFRRFVKFLMDGDESRLVRNKENSLELINRYTRTVRLLRNNVDAISNLVMAYKRITTVAGHTSRVSELLEQVKHLSKEGPAHIFAEGAAKRKAQKALTAGDAAAADKSADLPPVPPPMRTAGDAISFDRVTISSPDGTVLVRDLTFTVELGKSVLLTGPNGSGKSSLFRVLAGLWPAQGGTVTCPQGKSIFYLSQRPYLVSGNLRDQVLYPYSSTSTITTAALQRSRPTSRVGSALNLLSLKGLKGGAHEEGVQLDIHAADQLVTECLEAVELGYLARRFPKGLDANANWEDLLSGGERQRLAMARLLYHRPVYAVLDECTSAVSADGERHLYERCLEAGVTVLSIAHRVAVRSFHQIELKFDGERNGETAKGWSIENIAAPASLVAQSA